MKIDYSLTANGELLVTLTGDMDATGCTDLRPSFEQLAEDTGLGDISLDLSDVGFIDSSGIGAIVFLFKRLRSSSRSLRLINVHGQPEELIKLLRVDTAIPVTAPVPEQQQCAN